MLVPKTGTRGLKHRTWSAFPRAVSAIEHRVFDCVRSDDLEELGLAIEVL